MTDFVEIFSSDHESSATTDVGESLRTAFRRDKLLRAMPVPASGILYAEDFTPQDPPPSEEPEVPSAPEPPPITTADLMAAHARGHAEGFEAASRELAAGREQLHLAALQSMSDALAAAGNEAEAVARSHASQVAGTALAMLQAAIPATMARHADVEAQGFAAALLPLLRHEARLNLRAHPDRLPVLLAAAQDASLEVHSAPDPAMAPSEFELSWGEGSVRTDPRALWTMMREALSPLHLPELKDLFHAE